MTKRMTKVEREQLEREQRLLPTGSPIFMLEWGSSELPRQALIAKSYKSLLAAWRGVVSKYSGGWLEARALYAGVVVEPSQSYVERFEKQVHKRQERLFLRMIASYVIEVLENGDTLPGCITTCPAPLPADMWYSDTPFPMSLDRHSTMNCEVCRGYGWLPLGMTYLEFLARYGERLRERIG